MKPQRMEIAEVDQAIALIKRTDSYNEAQKAFLRDFLRGYAQDDLNEKDLEIIFGDKFDIIDALHNLHEFARTFENEEKAFNRFKEKIEGALALFATPRHKLH